MKRGKRIVFLACGLILVGLAALGIFLPLLPTTPFALLAAACFARSSPRLYNWLVNTKYLGAYIRNYREKTGITSSVRRAGLVFLWVSLLISALLTNRPLVRIVLLAVGTAVSIYICSLPAAAEREVEGCPATAMRDDAPEPPNSGGF